MLGCHFLNIHLMKKTSLVAPAQKDCYFIFSSSPISLPHSSRSSQPWLGQLLVALLGTPPCITHRLTSSPLSGICSNITLPDDLNCNLSLKAHCSSSLPCFMPLHKILPSDVFILFSCISLLPIFSS